MVKNGTAFSRKEQENITCPCLPKTCSLGLRNADEKLRQISLTTPRSLQHWGVIFVRHGGVPREHPYPESMAHVSNSSFQRIRFFCEVFTSENHMGRPPIMGCFCSLQMPCGFHTFHETSNKTQRRYGRKKNRNKKP